MPRGVRVTVQNSVWVVCDHSPNERSNNKFKNLSIKKVLTLHHLSVHFGSERKLSGGLTPKIPPTLHLCAHAYGLTATRRAHDHGNAIKNHFRRYRFLLRLSKPMLLL